MSTVKVNFRGGGWSAPAPAELDDAIDSLVRQLSTEEWAEPDDEHTQGFVTRANGDSLTGYVDGLMRFDPDFVDGMPQPPRYRKVETVDEMRETFRRFVADELALDAVSGWVPKSEAGALGLPGREFRQYPAP